MLKCCEKIAVNAGKRTHDLSRPRRALYSYTTTNRLLLQLTYQVLLSCPKIGNHNSLLQIEGTWRLLIERIVALYSSCGSLKCKIRPSGTYIDCFYLLKEKEVSGLSPISMMFQYAYKGYLDCFGV